MSEFDQYRETYVSDIDKAIHFTGKGVDFFTEVKADILAPAFTTLSETPTVLDVGCGHGLIHRHLMRRAPALRVTGIDVAATVIEEARRANPENSYQSYDGNRFPYPDDSFDACYTICVLHHVEPEARDRVISEMMRVTRPGGLVCVVEHTPLNPLTQYIVRTCPLDENAKLLWPRETTRRLQFAGLKVTARRYFLFSPFGSRFFRLVDRMLGWLPIGAQYVTFARVPPAHRSPH